MERRSIPGVAGTLAAAGGAVLSAYIFAGRPWHLRWVPRRRKYGSNYRGTNWCPIRRSSVPTGKRYSDGRHTRQGA
jgi:hypothetical protein